MNQFDRRNFLKYGAGLAGMVLLGKFGLPVFAAPRASGPRTESAKSVENKPAAHDGFDTEVVEGAKFGLVIDVGACIGCRTCMWACKQENNTPDTISSLWIEVFELKSSQGVTGHPSLQDLKEGATTSYTEAPKPGYWYLPVQCNHCDNAPCVKVCPTGATHKEKDGFVVMDYERCIGCRLCVVACPYSARRFNWVKPVLPAEVNPLGPAETNSLVPVRPIGVVEKCTFCIHRVRRGKLPRCVEVCPVRARHFGDFNDPESEVSKLLRSNLSFRLLEEMNTSPRIWYITRGKKWYKE